MGVIKHSPTLVYPHSHSSPYLFFALAVSLARLQGAAATPTSKTPEGQAAEQPGVIEREINRLFLRLASSLNISSSSNVIIHRKRDLADIFRGIFSGGNVNVNQNRNGNGNGNGDGNGDGGHSSMHTTTTSKFLIPIAAPTSPRATATTVSSLPSAVPATSSPIPPPQTSAESRPTSQSDIGTQVTGTMPNGGVPGQQASLPPQNVNTPQPTGSQPLATTTVREDQPAVGGGGPVGNVGGPSPNKALVIGLVISLVMLALLGCFMGAFFLRRARRRRREREQTSTQDDTARMWDREAKHESAGNYEEKERNIPSPVASLDSRASLASSAVSQIRARTPGGTPAVPVPYNPSEISDDVSAHFAMLTPDHKVGVPVPYPLALHVPSRVQQAMLERDERWQQYELLRQNQSRTDDHSETSTIPRPLSRLPQRRSTRRSVTSGLASSSEAYTGMDSRRNSRRSTWENEPYSVSEVDRSRSEVATNDHRGAPSARSSMISNFTSPPLPSLQSHRSDSSYVSMIRVRRLPPLPGQRTSNDGFPFTASTESPSESENPFNTDPTVNISGMNNISEEPSSPESLEEGSRETTTEHRSEEWSAPIVSSVTGVARTASAQTVHYLGRSPSNGFGPRLPSSQNPFDDNPSRFSAADSIGETLDTHQIRGMINTFPTPPDSPRRFE